MHSQRLRQHYFQHVTDTIPEEIISLDKSIDPTHMLAAAANEGLIHTNNNQVSVSKVIKEGFVFHTHLSLNNYISNLICDNYLFISKPRFWP